CRVRLVRRLDRWDETTARLFAADCAEAALLGERASGREPDERPWAAVDAARRFARGEISRAEADAASKAATAAGAAARDAARAAARAAWAAAEAAGWAAAADAATKAADAATKAADAAAWAAADAAAWAAAEAAAWDAVARATAWDAAWDAKDALYRRLRLYLEGAELPPVEPLYGKEAPGE